MGIPGILKEIGKGERVALAKLAIEHLEKTQRPLRIAIDAAIWNFQTQAGQGGKNPALRTLFFRLLKILALPIHPVFVYDGKNKPLVKRGRTVSRWGTCVANEASKKLVQKFRFPFHVAPGEAEAECAFLQKNGLVDVVMSQDGDAIMFGSGVTLRNWSKEANRGNKTPTHVNLLDLPRIKEKSGLDPDGMILVALLSGGDYDQNGVPGFGVGLACEVARAGFGKELLELIEEKDDSGLQEWRERLQVELETNESGYFRKRHKAITIPDTFPDLQIIKFYSDPATSTKSDLPALEAKWRNEWYGEIDIPSLRQYTGDTFDWLYKPGAWNFVRKMAAPLLAHRLLGGKDKHYVNSVEQITERRQHFLNDGIPELRVSVVPAAVVDIDLDAEEDSPEYLAKLAEEEGGSADMADLNEPVDEPLSASQNPRATRKTQPWSPFQSEKFWVPETMVQLGAPALVEEWHQRERDTLADPKKFATRNCRSTRAKPAAVTARIEKYFNISKSTKTGHSAVGKGTSTAVASAQNGSESAISITGSAETVETEWLAETLRSHSWQKLQFVEASVLHDGKPAELGPEGKYQAPADSPLSVTYVEEKIPLPKPSPEGSAYNPITLSSPPVVNGHSAEAQTPQLHTPTKVACEQSTRSLEHVRLPSSVTQRKKTTKSPRKLRRQQLDETGSPRRLRPIESFFPPASPSPPRTNAVEVKARVPVEPALASRLVSKLPTEPVLNGLRALPRESLPGTWKEVLVDEFTLGAAAARQSQRPSLVNLAGSDG